MFLSRDDDQFSISSQPDISALSVKEKNYQLIVTNEANRIGSYGIGLHYHQDVFNR